MLAGKCTVLNIMPSSAVGDFLSCMDAIDKTTCDGPTDILVKALEVAMVTHNYQCVTHKQGRSAFMCSNFDKLHVS